MAGRASNEGPHGGSQRFHNHGEGPYYALSITVAAGGRTGAHLAGRATPWISGAGSPGPRSHPSAASNCRLVRIGSVYTVELETNLREA